MQKCKVQCIYNPITVAGALPLFEEIASEYVLIGSVECVGNESDLLECKHFNRRNNLGGTLKQCDHAGVICRGKLMHIVTVNYICANIAIFSGQKRI